VRDGNMRNSAGRDGAEAHDPETAHGDNQEAL